MLCKALSYEVARLWLTLSKNSNTLYQTSKCHRHDLEPQTSNLICYLMSMPIPIGSEISVIQKISVAIIHERNVEKLLEKID